MSSNRSSDELNSPASPSVQDVETQRREQVAQIVAFRRQLREPEEAAYRFPETVKEPEGIRWVPVFA